MTYICMNEEGLGHSVNCNSITVCLVRLNFSGFIEYSPISALRGVLQTRPFLLRFIVSHLKRSSEPKSFT